MRNSLRTSILVAVLAVGHAGVAGAAPRTIVGKWRYEDGSCQRPPDVVVIAPKGMGSDEWSCDFKTVSRSGNRVTWTGRCESANGDLLARRVDATERQGRLTIAFDGAANGPFVRCGK